MLSEEIMEHEKAIAQSYEPFLQDIVDHFCKYKFLWNLYIKSMSNLDVLMALATAAKTMPVRCLPTFS
jgi:DNA mismatch repair ATPase MutS